MSNISPAFAGNVHLSVINGQITTTSVQIATDFGKRHDDVLRKISSLECSPEFTARNFAVSEYIDASGKANKQYQITEDGFIFLVTGFTGKKAARTKENYITAFNHMRKQLFGDPKTLPTQPAPATMNTDTYYTITRHAPGQAPEVLPTDLTTFFELIATQQAFILVPKERHTKLIESLSETIHQSAEMLKFANNTGRRL